MGLRLGCSMIYPWHFQNLNFHALNSQSCRRREPPPLKILSLTEASPDHEDLDWQKFAQGKYPLPRVCQVDCGPSVSLASSIPCGLEDHNRQDMRDPGQTT